MINNTTASQSENKPSSSNSPSNQKDYELLNYLAHLEVVYRVAVREHQHLGLLTDYLRDHVEDHGFHVKSAIWFPNAPIPHGLITITYEGDKIKYNLLGEANQYDMAVVACELEDALQQYYLLQQ